MIKVYLAEFFTILFFMYSGSNLSQNYAYSIFSAILGGISISLLCSFSVKYGEENSAETHINIYISERKDGEEQ